MGARKIKIQLYGKDKTKEQIVSNNFGDYILDDICVSCIIEENLETSEYFLDAEFLIDDNNLYKSITEEATLKVQTDYGTELFSIVDVRKTLSRVVVFARQITITECIGTWLEDVRPEDKNGLEALTHMQENSVGQKNLEFESDISLRNTAYYYNQTLYDAIHISDNCFQIRWAGREIRRRGYKLIINEKLGEETGVVIRSGKNLIGFEASTNIDNIVTRIKPVGFNGRTIDGYIDSPLIDNYKYVRTQKMEYSHVKLREDLQSEGAEGEIQEQEPQEGDIIFDTLGELQNKLTELALLEYLDGTIDVLQADYTINFIDLSTTEEYKNYASAETIQLGDYINVYEEKHDVKITVRAISRKYNVMSQRVEEIGLSNKAMDDKESRQDAIEALKSRLDEVVEKIGYMNVGYAKIEDLEATNAQIENLRATKAEIESLEATNATIHVLNADVATIQNLVNGNLSSDNIHSLILSSSKVTVENGFIKNAMIDSLSADKILTGTINTNNVSIQSEDGSMLINGTTQQFKDSNGVVRIQIGKDASGNFTFCLFSQDGVGILIDEDGIKSGAIGDGLIVNDMINNNANISGGKLDINSVIKTINENGTETLKSSRIFLDEQNQSLQVAFNQLKTKVDSIEEVTIGGDLSSVIEQITTNTTALNIQQGQIDQLISNTTITKENGSTSQLKDEFNSVIDTVNSHTQTISSLETNYDTLNNTVASANSKVSKLEQNLDGYKVTVSETYTTKAESSKISSSVEDAQDTADSALDKANTNANTIANLTIKVNSAEQKITSDAIISTVTSSESWTTQTNNITKAQTTASNAQSTANVNANNISSLTTRISTAEQKITSDAIISTVTSSSNWKDQASTISSTQTTANNAKTTADTAKKTADTANTNANSALTKANTNATNISNLTTRVSTAEQKITSSAIISTVTSSSNWSTLNSNVTKAQTTADTAKTTADTNKTNISSLTSRVSTAESKITDTAIVNTVTSSATWKNQASTISTIQTQSQQTADKFSWIVKSGTSSSTMTLTDKMYSLISSNVTLKATNIKLEGYVTANGNFKIDTSGNMTAKNGTFSGSITSSTITSGTINGGTITGAKIVGSGNGNRIVINNGDYEIQTGSTTKGFLGLRTLDDGFDTARLALSSTGLTRATDNYFVIVPYNKNANPQSYAYPYVDIAYRCHGFKGDDGVSDVSNMKMYGDGVMRISPIKMLEITTNFAHGAYAGSGEGVIAKFLSVNSEYYDYCLDVRALRNYQNNNGLFMAARRTDGASENAAMAQLIVYSNGFRTFRPARMHTDILQYLGSGDYRWQTVYAVNSLNTSSDRTLKENIKYLSSTPNARTIKNEELSIQDMYDFVRDDLYLASYNWIADEEKEEKLGFIAQDIVDTKVGEKIIVCNRDMDNTLGYDSGNFEAVISGALQVAIQKIEQLEARIKELEGR